MGVWAKNYFFFSVKCWWNERHICEKSDSPSEKKPVPFEEYIPLLSFQQVKSNLVKSTLT